MGNSGAHSDRVGVSRVGPAERERQVELQAERQAERQRLCRARKKAAQRDLDHHNRICGGVQESVCGRQVRRATQSIIRSINSALAIFPGPATKELVMQKVLCSPLVNVVVPESKKNLAQQEVINGLVKSLSEVKNPSLAPNLATKHAILTAAISSGCTSSFRQKARVLGVHPRNVHRAVARRKAMESLSGKFMWTLSIRKKRLDTLSAATKAAVLLWWLGETRMSPNRKEVVRKRLEAFVYDEKPTQYLMETQVSFYMCPQTFQILFHFML